MSASDDLHARFGQNLRALRTSASMSQETLAHATSLPRNYVAQLELGQKVRRSG